MEGRLKRGTRFDEFIQVQMNIVHMGIFDHVQLFNFIAPMSIWLLRVRVRVDSVFNLGT